MDVFATVTAAAGAIELFAALLFANGFARRRSEREQGLAAVLCVAAAVHATATLAAMGSYDQRGGTLVVSRVGAAALVAALPILVHFAVLYSRAPRPGRRGLLWGYGFAGALAAGAVLSPPARYGTVGAVGAVGAVAWMPSSTAWNGIAAFVAATTALILIARAYLGGQRGTLPVVLGATMLLAAVINDIGVALGAFSTGSLTDLGLAAFVIGIATTPAANYVALAQELERRTDELRSRTRELRRSYEELTAAQEELVRKEQLAVVGELAAVIAHEVRNPLAIIANAGAGLRKPSISREDHDTLLAILDEETSRLNRLVTDLLRYARPVNVQRSHLPLPDLLERALSLTNDKKKIRCELRVDAAEGRIWGDANLLRQVFDNLIDNAVQAMGGEGTLTVRVRTATDATDGEVEGLAVDIIDTGEGMDTQVRSRALDPFFTTRPSGTGLGLAIVDRIVDAHGGRLTIESRAGEGTTVTVFLPRGVQPESQAGRVRGERPASDPARAP